MIAPNCPQPKSDTYAQKRKKSEQGPEWEHSIGQTPISNILCSGWILDLGLFVLGLLHVLSVRVAQG